MKLFFTKKILRKEILFTLLIKCLLLFIIWKVCFAHPLADKIQDKDVVQHLISSDAECKRRSNPEYANIPLTPHSALAL